MQNDCPQYGCHLPSGHIFQVDTGAAVNILPERCANSNVIKATLRKLMMWSNTQITPKLELPKNRKNTP